STGGGKWQGVLTHQDLEDFDRVAGSLLAELGYSAQRPAVTAPAVAGLEDRRGKLRSHVWSHGPSAVWRRRARRAHGRSAQDNQRLLDTLLTCINMRDVASLDALFEPTSEIQVVEGRDEWRARGAGAVSRLAGRMEAWNEQTPALVRSD